MGIDTADLPEISDEQMRRIVDLVRPVIDEYMQRTEQMAQRCFIDVPGFDAFEQARKEFERDAVRLVATDDPMLEGYQW